MPTIPERLETATAQVETDSGLLHDIVHGASSDPDVTTEGGDVKPIAKVVAEAEAAIAVFTSGLVTRVSFPANTAASGAVGQFAINGDELAVYVTSIGWVFFTGFTK